MKVKVILDLSPKRKNSEKASNSDEINSFNDTIFYDAFDAIIYNEIEKETKTESNPIEYKDSEIRTTLPSLKTEGKFSLLKILKDAIGKDLTKF
jgi:hypothetical protein